MEKQATKIVFAVNLVKKLAGSVKVPKKFRKISTEQIIREARRGRFTSKNSVLKKI